MPASERVPQVGLTPGAEPAPQSVPEPAPDAAPQPGPEPGSQSVPQARAEPGTEALLHGELTVRGRVQDASNAVLFCETVHEGRTVACVYKPVRGERPLWDFPDGTLAQREVAAYLVSEATGWGLIPPTVLRDGPYGEGMVQLWIEAEEAGDDAAGAGVPADGAPAAGGQLLALTEVGEPGPGWKPIVEARLEEGRTALLVHADDIRLRRLAILDAVINNADRKGGHLLPAAGGRLYGIDHGVTFHTEDKLRTLLWGWAGEPLPAEAVPVLEKLHAELAGELGERLRTLITPAETEAVRARTGRLLATGTHPAPGGEWPSIPWPPV